MENHILSCDWGTSSFRLRLVDTNTGEIKGERATSEGVAPTFQAWQDYGRPDRIVFYRNYLNDQIGQLSDRLLENFSGLPVFLSGMASSSIGMVELPYADLPFELSGKALIAEKLPATEVHPNELILISGLKSDSDVMRGEELQIMGLSHLLPKTESISLFPGTHSKHIWVKEGQINNFRTFMTGEFFQLTANYSILRSSLEQGEAWGKEEEAQFIGGVQKAVSSNLLNGLFSVRTNALLRQIPAAQNFYYLSGLTIGYELKTLLDVSADLFLCGGGNLSELYEKAFSILGLQEKLRIIPAATVDQSVTKGHLLFSKKRAL